LQTVFAELFPVSHVVLKNRKQNTTTL